MDEWLDFSELIDKVQELFDLGLFDEAKELLDNYFDLFSGEWELYFLYSRLFTDQNRPNEAISYLHKGLQLDKTNPDLLLGLFYANAMMGETRKGGRYLLRAYKYNPENELILSALIYYHTEMNDPETALSFYEKIQKNGGTTNPETYRNAALAFDRAGRTDEGEQCFKTALELNPQFDEVRDLLADHYMFIGDGAKAIKLYQDALIASPKNLRIMSRIVFCLSQDNQHDEAARLAKETIRIYPNSPVGYVDLAYVYLNNNEYERGIVQAEKALDTSPIDPEAFRVKGIAYAELGKAEEAEKAFSMAHSLDPENPEILRDFYHYLRDLKQYDKMEELVQKTINIETPYCMEDYWFLADYYRERKQNRKALDYLHKAFKSVPTENELIPPIVDILLDEGHTRMSLPFLASYVEKNGWNEVMTQFAKHKRLKGKWAQESVRFLRYYGQHPYEYRRYIFSKYMERTVASAATALFLLFLIPAFLLYKLPGVIFISAFYTALASTYFITKHLVRRNKKWSELAGDIFPE